MKEEDVDKLLAAADEGFQVAGFDSFEKAVDHACTFLGGLLDLMSKARTRESAKAAFMQVPDLPPEEFQRALSFLPKIAYMIRGFAPDVVKNIPHDPGGRPEAVTYEQKKAICRQILELHGKRVLLRDAFTRLAAKHGVSVTTIRRVWRGREALE
jgi:hypothetical protein